MKSPAALDAAFAAGDLFAVLTEALSSQGASSVLDIGCGHGDFARHLAAKGIAVTGLDPQGAAITAARLAAPSAVFVEGSAEGLPFADGAFDAIVFLNSLHHVPEPGMDAALAEAARAVRTGGTVLVAEPLAEGSFFELVRPVEDETEVRAAAARAVARAVAAGRFALRGNVVFDRRESFPDVEAAIRRIVEVDPARAEAAESNRASIEAAFAAGGRRENGSVVFVQPQRVYWLRVA